MHAEFPEEEGGTMGAPEWTIPNGNDSSIAKDEHDEPLHLIPGVADVLGCHKP